MSRSQAHNGFPLTLRAAIHNPRGRLIRTLPEIPAHSLIAAFLKLLKIQVSIADESIIDTTNNLRGVGIHVNAFNANAAAGQTTIGIVIGTNDTPPAMADYKLNTQVTTNILHSIMSFNLNAPDASTYQFIVSRTFTNNTGSTVQIREVGLYLWAASAPWIFCAERSLYSVDVPTGLSVTFTYTFTISL